MYVYSPRDKKDFSEIMQIYSTWKTNLKQSKFIRNLKRFLEKMKNKLNKYTSIINIFKCCTSFTLLLPALLELCSLHLFMC